MRRAWMRSVASQRGRKRMGARVSGSGRGAPGRSTSSARLRPVSAPGRGRASPPHICDRHVGPRGDAGQGGGAERAKVRADQMREAVLRWRRTVRPATAAGAGLPAGAPRCRTSPCARAPPSRRGCRRSHCRDRRAPRPQIATSPTTASRSARPAPSSAPSSPTPYAKCPCAPRPANACRVQPELPTGDDGDVVRQRVSAGARCPPARRECFAAGAWRARVRGPRTSERGVLPSSCHRPVERRFDRQVRPRHQELAREQRPVETASRARPVVRGGAEDQARIACVERSASGRDRVRTSPAEHLRYDAAPPP